MTLKRFFIGIARLFFCLSLPMMEPVMAKTAPKSVAKHAAPTASASESRKASTEVVSSIRPFGLLGHIAVNQQARIIDYPILSGNDGDLSAFQLAISYNTSAVEILGITSPIPEVGMAYDFVGDEIQFRWTRRVPADIHRGDTLAFLKIHLKRKANSHIDRYFSLNTNGCKAVRADGGRRIETDWQMALPTITYATDVSPIVPPAAIAHEETKEKESASKQETRLKQQGAEWDQFEILSVIPNPTKTWADITYSISGDCSVYLKLFSPLNQEVMTLVNSGRRTGLYRHNITVSDVAAGIYFLRLETCRDDMQELSDMMKVVVRE